MKRSSVAGDPNIGYPPFWEDAPHFHCKLRVFIESLYRTLCERMALRRGFFIRLGAGTKRRGLLRGAHVQGGLLESLGALQ